MLIGDGLRCVRCSLPVSDLFPEAVWTDEANRRPAGVEGEVGAEHYYLVHSRLYNLRYCRIGRLEFVPHSTLSARANWPPTRKPRIQEEARYSGCIDYKLFRNMK